MLSKVGVWSLEILRFGAERGKSLEHDAIETESRDSKTISIVTSNKKKKEKKKKKKEV